jgi:DNA-binding ferritin-like protein
MEGPSSINDYMTRIQQVDEVAKRTIALQEKRIPEKYSSIETTLKLLQNLIATYRRRADAYEQDLKARAKIDDLTTQISFHNDRLTDCERLSQKLSAKIS